MWLSDNNQGKTRDNLPNANRGSIGIERHNWERKTDWEREPEKRRWNSLIVIFICHLCPTLLPSLPHSSPSLSLSIPFVPCIYLSQETDSKKYTIPISMWMSLYIFFLFHCLFLPISFYSTQKEIEREREIKREGRGSRQNKG